MKISNFDSFRKGELDGKLMTKVILLFFVLVLLGVVNASAVELSLIHISEPTRRS